jgi:hypothetical protein
MAMTKSKEGMGTAENQQYMAKGGKKKMMAGGKNAAAKVSPMAKGGKYKMAGTVKKAK